MVAQEAALELGVPGLACLLLHLAELQPQPGKGTMVELERTVQVITLPAAAAALAPQVATQQVARLGPAEAVPHQAFLALQLFTLPVGLAAVITQTLLEPLEAATPATAAAAPEVTPITAATAAPAS